jgi:TolB-like protein/Flp pilus assembly protein TadD
MDAPPDVFLSYNRDDQVVARRFAEAFERQGISVWWDVALRSGEAYDQITEKALKTAKAVVVLWSKKSVDSRWVRAEATLADRNRTLVPAMIEICDRPIMFELTQTADLSHWQGAPEDKTWLAFLTDVRRFVGAAGAVPGEPVPVAGRVAPSAISNPTDYRPSLAILPFTNRSGERADDVFSEGMVEDLISALSSSAIKVIAQSATIVYRKNVSDLRTIGHELGVRYLLEGNVRRVGSLLRVSSQLVEAASASIMWTQKFDRPLTQLAELQEQLVLEVAANLGVQMERIEVEQALKKPGELTAWEAVMRATYLTSNYSADVAHVSIRELRSAIVIAPDYALAHAALGSTLAVFYSLSLGGRDVTVAREAREHAERALELNANDPLVLSYAAYALFNCGSLSEAMRHLQRALDINPNSARAREYMALACIRSNRPDEAIAHLDACAILAPRSYQAHQLLGYRAVAHFYAGRYEQALQAVEEALLLQPRFVYTLKDKAVICEKLGRHEEARQTVRRLHAASPGTTLEELEAANLAFAHPPERVSELSEVFRKVWLDTPRVTLPA